MAWDTAGTRRRLQGGGRTFDYHAAHLEPARLLHWDGLAGGRGVGLMNRTAHDRDRVEAVAAAQRARGLDDDPLDDARRHACVVRPGQRLALPGRG